jgi:hypothetical protein
MSERLAKRIGRLIELIVGAGGFGSVTILVERGRVAHLVWSVNEKINDPCS